MTTDKDSEHELALKYVQDILKAWGKTDGVLNVVKRIRQDARAELQAEIDLTYEMWCGRDYMHLPLHDAVGEAIKHASASACREALLEATELRVRLAKYIRHHPWCNVERNGSFCTCGLSDILSNHPFNDNSCDTCKHKAVDCSCWEGRLPDDGDCPDHETTKEGE